MSDKYELEQSAKQDYYDEHVRPQLHQEGEDDPEDNDLGNNDAFLDDSLPDDLDFDESYYLGAEAYFDHLYLPDE